MTPGELPFYESYFSNYMEGTVFTIGEARRIVETQQQPSERPADGHDILGTYRCVMAAAIKACTEPLLRPLVGSQTARTVKSAPAGLPASETAEAQTLKPAGTRADHQGAGVRRAHRRGGRAFWRSEPAQGSHVLS